MLEDSLLEGWRNPQVFISHLFVSTSGSLKPPSAFLMSFTWFGEQFYGGDRLFLEKQVGFGQAKRPDMGDHLGRSWKHSERKVGPSGEL